MFDVSGMDPIASHQAGLYQDGIHKTHCRGFVFKASIETRDSSVIGQQSPRTRVTGVSYSGDITFYKNDPFLVEYVKHVQENQHYEPFDLTGVIDDPESDFCKKYGVQTVTLQNCVLTGDLTLMEANANKDDVEEKVSFKAERMVA